MSAEVANCAMASRYGSGLRASLSSTACSALHVGRVSECAIDAEERNGRGAEMIVAEDEVGKNLSDFCGHLWRNSDVGHGGESKR